MKIRRVRALRVSSSSNNNNQTIIHIQGEFDRNGFSKVGLEFNVVNPRFIALSTFSQTIEKSNHSLQYLYRH